MFCWGDARLGNMMFSPPGERLAVLDWEMACLGLPSQDLGWAWFIDRNYTSGMGVDRLSGFASKEATIARYEQRSGRKVTALDYYELFAGFRFSVIMGRLAIIFKDWGLIEPDSRMTQENGGGPPDRCDPQREEPRLMLSPLDELSIHQVAETMATVGTSDRNFYDRWYFSMHGSTDEFFMVLSLGQYPNRDVTDAFICASYRQTQTVIRASRPLGLDRLDTRVGPLRVEVVEGLKRVRFLCEETDGFAVDAVWEGVIPAYEEPRMLMETSFAWQR